jgi:serine protease Do
VGYLLALALSVLVFRADNCSLAAGAHASVSPASLTRSSVESQPLAVAFSKPTPTSIADLKNMEDRVKALVKQVSPAVVAVEVGNGSGSGVVISADGLVITAGHVFDVPNREVRFTFPDGKTVRGKTLGIDRDSDAGVMRITEQGSWPHVPMGDLKQARAGDWVLALGHPGGFDLKRSLVVRLGRIIEFDSDALQTDCTISPGDSGGPLFDMHGKVIGIHSFIASAMAENFHVPITKYSEAWDRLVRAESSDDEPQPRAYVGASGVDDPAGCRLSKVDKNGPAFKAGLKVGDVVVKVSGRGIKASASFRRWIAESEPGETLNLEIKRGDKLLSLNVKLDVQSHHH